MEPEFIDTVSALQAFLTQLGDCDGQPPRFYIDLEGNNLSRHGTLSLLTLLLEPEHRVFLVDVTTLGRDAFTTEGSDGRTLQHILESKDIVKVFFDIRNDSDALFALYNIRAAGIEDLQLMELASRNFNKRNVNGLAKCIERDSTIPFDERRRWQAVKDKGRNLFAPELGGSYAVFDRRPLSKEIQDYCIQDVVFMPNLRNVYRGKLCDAWWRKIETETLARIRLSQSPNFNGKGQHMARGPCGWVNWAPTLIERRSRVFLEAPSSRVRGQVPPQPIVSRASPPAEEVDELAETMRRVELTTLVHKRSTSSNEGSATGYNSYGEIDGYDSDHAFSQDGDGSQDFTACDQECGYCGRCSY